MSREETSVTTRAAQEDIQREAARGVARGIALALSSEESRLALRRTLRDSRVTDHKVQLLTFATTAPGQSLLSRAGQESGKASAEWSSALAALPAMDFYVPFQSHRKTWRGTNDVLVAASFDPDAEELIAFDVEGNAHTLRRSAGVPNRTLVILHPSEPTAAIPAEMQAFNGAIEGDRMVTAGIEEDDGSGGSGSGGSPTPGVYLTSFYSYRDDGWWGALEMSFRSFAYEGIPQFVGYWLPPSNCSKGTAVQTFPHPNNTYNTLTLISPGVTNVLAVGCTFTSFPRGYELVVREMDGGWNGSADDFGERFFAGSGNPFGATVGSIQEYWSCDGQPTYSACGVYPYQDLDPAMHSVDLKLEYR